jgi:putative hydrolase of the HAD superfamily
MAIQTIITDLGGVFVLQAERPQRQDWEQRSGMTERALFRLIDKAGLAQAADVGKITSSDVWQRMAEKTGLDVQLLREVQEGMLAAEYINQPLADFFQSLRPRYKLVAISNAWSDVHASLERKFNLSQYFDEQFFSCEVGLAKPDIAIYQFVLHSLHVDPTRTIFLDDKIDNVDSSQIIGMNGIHYRQSDQAIAAIEKLLERA